jgi:hypothetical protein
LAIAIPDRISDRAAVLDRRSKLRQQSSHYMSLNERGRSVRLSPEFGVCAIEAPHQALGHDGHLMRVDCRAVKRERHEWVGAADARRVLSQEDAVLLTHS